ncbi:uncharacterized protein LOC118415946 isoform X1 [Branchiostoma floridae]|uniref:Uncharacterized protein LOC118415946 isoform X1 n=2 Tax=Branchiostoma floridae TaxID=7739 RepID=A0A9J7L749_BRAFL|nr:uncharacterized protein LOC118415946 isoform X1 [Branchiostoma floridae]
MITRYAITTQGAIVFCIMYGIMTIVPFLSSLYVGYKCRVAGGDAVLKSVDILTPKRACLSDSSQGGGKDCHGSRDCFSEGDRNPPMTGVVGFSKETTLALLPRMHMEELQSELNRRNIVVKLAGEHQRGRGDLEHVLREVMTREYEVEGDEGMDTTNTSSAFVHCSSNTSSAFQHCSQLGQALLRPNNNQASLQNAPELSQPTEKGQASSRQAAEASSTNTCPGQVQVKKESKIVYDFEQHTNSVAGVTEPSTSQTQYPGIVHGPQSNCARSQNLIVKIKTEPGLEEETEGEQLQDLRSELCPSSPGQLSQELDRVDVFTEGQGGCKPSTSSEEPVKLWEIQGQQLHQGEPEPVAAQGSQKRFASLDTKQLNELEDLELTVHNTTVRSTRWGAKIFKGG